MNLSDKIVIYRTADGQTVIKVKLEDDTVWLSANQMAALFERDEKTIRKHINNVFSENELEKKNNTHFLRVDGVKQPVAFYSLDVIISVGYRVKSQRGTQFRIWANKVLKEYLVKGYAVNKALTEQRYTELKQLVAVLGRTVKAQEALTSDDALNLVEVVSDYAYALDRLDKYDYQQLAVEQTTNEAKFRATYEGAMQAVKLFRSNLRGVSDKKFFLFRIANLYAYPHSKSTAPAFPISHIPPQELSHVKKTGRGCYKIVKQPHPLAYHRFAYISLSPDVRSIVGTGSRCLPC